MATKIEWTRGDDGSMGETWNPLRARNKVTGQIGWHCEVVSAGCCMPGEITCYANQRNKGFFQLGTRLPYTRTSRDKVEIYLDEQTLLHPLHWRKPRRIFVCSMTDLFGEWHTDEMIDRVFAVMALAPQHQFQVLTKRAERMSRYIELARYRVAGIAFANALRGASRVSPEEYRYSTWPLPNVWLGVSVEDQKRADERIPLLLETPAAVRFLSCEPLLAPIEFSDVTKRSDAVSQLGKKALNAIHWVIVGGESGPGARPFHLEHARSLIAQCKAADVAVFMKQLGARPLFRWGDEDSAVGLTLGPPDDDQNYPVRLKDKKGGDPSEWPADLRVREFPRQENHHG